MTMRFFGVPGGESDPRRLELARERREQAPARAAAMRAKMAALGYTREMDPATNGADLVVLVQANVSNNYTAYSYYPYDPFWGYYPGWGYWGGYPGYGGYYPWVLGYPTTVVTNTKTGSIIIEIVDPNVEGSAPEGPSLTVRWAAVLNGLAEGTATGARATIAIDQAFRQSPYLGT